MIRHRVHRLSFFMTEQMCEAISCSCISRQQNSHGPVTVFSEWAICGGQLRRQSLGKSPTVEFVDRLLGYCSTWTALLWLYLIIICVREVPLKSRQKQAEPAVQLVSMACHCENTAWLKKARLWLPLHAWWSPMMAHPWPEVKTWWCVRNQTALNEKSTDRRCTGGHKRHTGT